MINAININFKLNKPYTTCRMRNNIFDIASVLTTITFNGYTIIEIVNSSAFPIILALGSLSLTIVLIIVQLKKLKLVKQQLKSEIIETQKKELELKQLQDEEPPLIKLG